MTRETRQPRFGPSAHILLTELTHFMSPLPASSRSNRVPCAKWLLVPLASRAGDARSFSRVEMGRIDFGGGSAFQGNAAVTYGIQPGSIHALYVRYSPEADA